MITRSHLDALFEPWTAARHILVAVSGGPDSIALLHMLAQWRQTTIGQNAKRPKLTSATVDHSLRPDSRNEAAAVQHFAHALDIEHRILTWDHNGPETGIQEQARNARYDLLSQHALDQGADILMSGHHADDQAETILFRLARGSGLHGLTGMARQRTLRVRAADNLSLARPLLEMRKQDLVAYCQANAITFALDPSNQNARFARPRLRTILPELESEGLGPAEWARFARRMRRADDALEAATNTAWERHGSGELAEGLTINFSGLANEPDEIMLRVLIAAVSRFEPAKHVRLERAEALAEQLKCARLGGKIHNATLGQARLSLNAKGILTLKRQAARKRGMR